MGDFSKLLSLSEDELRRLLMDDAVCRKIAYTATHSGARDLVAVAEAMGFDATVFGTLFAKDRLLRERLMGFISEESSMCYKEMAPLVKVKALKKLYEILTGHGALDEQSDKKLCDVALKTLQVFVAAERWSNNNDDDDDEYDDLMSAFSGMKRRSDDDKSRNKGRRGKNDKRKVDRRYGPRLVN